jgi:hypothetical protein
MRQVPLVSAWLQGLAAERVFPVLALGHTVSCRAWGPCGGQTTGLSQHSW